MNPLRIALLLALAGSTALGALPAKGKKKAAKPRASSMVDGEGAMPSPIKPVKLVSPEEMASRFFKEALSPYGDWLDLGEYGRCWKPKDISENWAPYTVGAWAYSRYGWTWMSNEDFGGIVYHYGRWVHAVEEGWCWVPDLEWAAAWVSWRYGTEAIGWAPLPPKAEWNTTVGIGVWVDKTYDIGPENYTFCAISDFDAPDLQEVIFSPVENADSVLHTVNITNISPLGKSIFCGGPAYDWVAARVKGTVPVVAVVKERSLIKFRELLNEATDAPVSFKAVLRKDKLTLVAPEWGHIADPRRADALGFTGEIDDSQSKPKWVEGQTDDAVAEKSDKPQDAPVVEEIPVLTGWEGLRANTRAMLKAKVSREVAGLSPQTYPAEPFNPNRDTPSGQ